MRIIFIYILFSLTVNVSSQVRLSLDDVIDTALMNNYDIRIARLNNRINRSNNTYGVAGGLPVVNGSATDNNSNYNLKQKTSSGLDLSQDNVRSSSINAGITASIVLFNGFKIIAAKGRLNLLQRQSEFELNQQIQNTMADIMVKYYDIIRQESNLKIIQSSLDVSSKKLEIINQRARVGMSNEADILQAKIDLNIEAESLRNQQLIIEQYKTDLLQLMGVKVFFPIIVNDTIIIDGTISKDSIISYLTNNQQYLSAIQQVNINEQIVKEVRSQRIPSIRLNTGYNFIYNSNQAGFNLFTQNYGPTVGASLQMPIFNGTIFKKQQDVASFNVENAKLEKENLLLSLTAQALKTYQSYQSAIQQLDTQRLSYEDAGKLVRIVVQRFSLNAATILDVKAAQASFESAGYTFINLQFAAKIAEIELKRLNYQLGN